MHDNHQIIPPCTPSVEQKGPCPFSVFHWLLWLGILECVSSAWAWVPWCHWVALKAGPLGWIASESILWNHYYRLLHVFSESIQITTALLDQSSSLLSTTAKPNALLLIAAKSTNVFLRFSTLLLIDIQ